MSNAKRTMFMADVTDATQEGRKVTAQEVNIIAAKEIANLVRSTLGPMGMDKMLVKNDGNVTVTNDGATILREVNITHPTARMIIQVAKTQEAECYDGTTSAVILAGELMKQTEQLLGKGIHPTMIVRGFKAAAKRALEHVENIGIEDNDKTLHNVAITAMTGKSAEDEGEHLAELCVQAAIRSSPNDVNITIRPGAPVSDSFFTDGCIVDKSKMTHSMPESIEDARIALFDCELGNQQLGQGVNMSFNDSESANQFMADRKAELINLAETVVQSGANVVLSLKDINPTVAEQLSKMGVYAARRVAASDLESVAIATGASIVSTPEELEPADLGKCAKVYEKKFELSPRPLLFFEGVPNDTVSSIMVFAPTEHLAFEIGRALDDAVGVVHIAHKDSSVIAGGGSAYMSMSLAVKEYASSVGGRAQLAVEAFATALEVIPSTLAENCGLSPIDTLLKLRVAHSEGHNNAYVDVYTGEIETSNVVVEPKRVVKTAVQSATDTACMILRIDNIVTAKEPDEFGM